MLLSVQALVAMVDPRRQQREDTMRMKEIRRDVRSRHCLLLLLLLLPLPLLLLLLLVCCWFRCWFRCFAANAGACNRAQLLD